MYIVCVHVHVKPEHRAAFVEATLDNAKNTVQEPGNVRFDVLEQNDDPNRFVLYEPEFRLNDERQGAWVEGLPIAFVES